MPEPVSLAEERARYRAHYYAQLPEPLIDDPDVTVAELRVYGWLDRRAGARGWWHCSQREIASALGLARRATDIAVRKLVARGLLDVLSASYRVRCFELPERIGRPSARSECAHRASQRPISGVPAPDRGHRTLLDRKSPPQSPYTDTRRKTPQRSGPDPYAHVVQRVWPPDEQGRLGL
jgi:hypothetical protein